MILNVVSYRLPDITEGVFYPKENFADGGSVMSTSGGTHFISWNSEGYLSHIVNKDLSVTVIGLQTAQLTSSFESDSSVTVASIKTADLSSGYTQTLDAYIVSIKEATLNMSFNTILPSVVLSIKDTQLTNKFEAI